MRHINAIPDGIPALQGPRGMPSGVRRLRNVPRGSRSPTRVPSRGKGNQGGLFLASGTTRSTHIRLATSRAAVTANTH